MNKLLKIFFWSLSILILIIIIFLSVTYFQIANEWKQYYTKDEIKLIAEDISASPELSHTFYNIYDNLYDDRYKSVHKVYLSSIYHTFILDTNIRQASWHIQAAYHLPKRGMVGYSNFKLGLGLENFITPEKCFDFAMDKNFLNLNQYEINFENHPSEMNDTTEILKFLIALDSPSYLRSTSLLENEILRRKIMLMKK